MNQSVNPNIVKNIQFETCGQLYDKLRQKSPRFYRNSPSTGVKVNVEYVDTFGESNAFGDNIKTIVAIHGNPGHYKHFSGLFEYFSGKSVRVIVPNMPDFSITRQKMAFWHSNEERSQFIRDFLKALNVSTIDCLISHSAGIHPISLLWTNPQELTIRSIGIFSPQYLSDRFFKINKFFAIFTTNKLGIAVMDWLKPHELLKGRSPMTYNSVDEVLFFALVHSYIENTDYYKKLEVLKTMKLPTIVVYGESDKLVSKRNFEEFVERLGAQHKDFSIYSMDNQIEKDLNHINNWIKVLNLKSGGHFAYQKFSQIVGKHLERDLLSKL
ncbi:uncharacterized protein LOC128952249 [Oppia nitens]|uniref:uncharacterized protein LOC128952249 n=1 Tax=Oppia nitens TaxID=1686743 RepID=UPI0023DB5340|nr:uncharacterized protein LOC128952249 [Oppia nitens]